MKKNLEDSRVLITAGPTYEAIDPVRFIGNRSSGKMGIAIANAIAKVCKECILIKGPTHLVSEVKEVKVESAAEMYEACSTYWPKVDIAIMCAAVADFRPKTVANKKIKKKDQKTDGLLLELEPTTDILAQLGKQKNANQTLIGFALETHDAIENAKSKLNRKNLDFIVLNSLRAGKIAFGVDTNQITIIDKHNNITNFELKPKVEVALDILNYLETYLS